MRFQFVLALSLSLLSFVCLGQENQLTLDLNWKLESPDTNIEVPASVPGCVHLDLMAAGIIEDPFYGNNESRVQWISEKSWTYTSSPFYVSPSILDYRDVQLKFKCLDTYAEVWLNGVKILSANNYFREWSVNVDGHLKEEGNILKVVFLSPILTGQDLIENQKHPLPGEAIRAVSRKPQFHYGWDWGPKLTSSGIQGDIELLYSKGVKIEDVWLKQNHRSDGAVELHCFTQYSCSEPFSGDIQVQIRNIATSKQVSVGAGVHVIEQIIDLPSSFPKWWPADHGEQTMHKLNFSLTSSDKTTHDKEALVTGIRDIQLINEKDSLGSSFYFSVNGTPIFMKGANYIPQDIFQTRVEQSQYRDILQAAHDCGMNMLRVWGGGIYESDEFYSMCDSLGIMIWQDFMFACAMYPGDQEYIANVNEEAQFQVKRLSSHPCIALWCGNNESSEGWHRWGWQNDLGFFQKRRIWRSYKKVFQKTLPQSVSAFSSTPYWESSPSLGRGDPRHQFEGDAHYWGVWHDAEPFENFELKVPRFMSEFGFQSFPSMLSINSFSEPSDQTLDSPKILAHEKHSRGISLINEYMLRDFGVVPTKFEEYVVLSQFVQAEGMRKGIDAHRISQPYCMGTLYWQLNDCWPAASWSSIDNLGIWKPLHWIAKNSFQSRQLMFKVDTLKIAGYLVSDRGIAEGQPLQVQFDLIDFSGSILHSETFNIMSTGACSEHLFDLNLKDLKNIDFTQCFAQMALKDESRNIDLKTTTYLKAPKDLQLEPSNLQIEKLIENGEVKITLRASTYIPRVWLSSSATGSFSKNYFPLQPDQVQVIRFNSTHDELNEIQIDCLNDFLVK